MSYPQRFLPFTVGDEYTCGWLCGKNDPWNQFLGRISISVISKGEIMHSYVLWLWRLSWIKGSQGNFRGFLSGVVVTWSCRSNKRLLPPANGDLGNSLARLGQEPTSPVWHHLSAKFYWIVFLSNVGELALLFTLSFLWGWCYAVGLSTRKDKIGYLSCHCTRTTTGYWSNTVHASDVVQCMYKFWKMIQKQIDYISIKN